MNVRDLASMRTSRCLALLAFAIGLSACADEVHPLKPPASADRSTAGGNSSTLGRPQNVRPEESAFAELADVAPSAAGFYYDSTGTLIARVRDPRDDPGAIGQIRRLVTTHPELNPGGALRATKFKVVRADFTYRQLSEWRDVAFDHVLGSVAGVRLLDLDEAHNRVTLALDDASFATTRATVVQTLGGLGVDSAALRFIVAPATPIHLNLATPSMLTSATTDPLAAGLLITYGGYGCTLGFVAVRNNVTGFVTASHCSNSMYGLDGTQYLQGGRFVATETVDPNGYTCGILLRTCRGADANFSAAANNYPMSVGLILHTTGLNNGALTVNQVMPYWTVVQAGPTPALGQRVDKVGMTTGWTSGQVDGTCQDAYPTGWTVTRCTVSATYGAGDGDSGAPVFVILPYYVWQDGTEVALVGVHSSTWGDRYFSPLSRIESDLGGTWNVIARPPASATGPLRVYIDGPTDVLSSPSCNLQYHAVAADANGIETYTWSTDGTILADNQTEYVSVAFPTVGTHWIQVAVRDVTGAEVSYTMSDIVAGPSGMDCHNY